MTTSMLTLPILSVHSLIDAGVKVHVEDIFGYIESRAIFDFLLSENKDKEGVIVEGFNFINSFPKDKQLLLDALERLANTVSPEDLGVANRENGLLFLDALLNELIQSNVDEITLK
jgi:GTP:adenosylcobinamide-phosphate guanylyltransferase